MGVMKMVRRIDLCLGLWIGILVVAVGSARAEPQTAPVAVACAKGGTLAERLAAQEVRRYVYLRTGKLLPIVAKLEAAPPGGVIVVTFPCKMRLEYFGLAENADLQPLSKIPLLSDQYLLKTVEHQGRPLLVLSGGYPVGPLYAAYRLAEHLGVRFYLHGDVVPDEPIELKMPELDQTAEPLFDRRGIQPFHDFPEGPDWWNADGYKAILGQLPKLRMNFFGLHTYPQGGVGPEPTTWIGTAEDVNLDGTVKFSYPARHFTTGNVTGAWGYRPMNTGQYSFGAAAIFDRDDYAADYMLGTAPWTKMSPAQSNELFNRFGSLLKDTFTFARRLGIKTCLGTETPLVIPTAVQERLKAAGKDPKDPAVVQEVYEGIFQRIRLSHPLDYYWFWTPEDWTWGEVKKEQIDATLADFRAAIAAAKKVKAPFSLATCGWVLGPQQDRALFDNTLPKDMPMSCINREVGHAPVEPGFAKVEGRPKWAIPWLEDDPAMIIPQLWAGRMRQDAADALKYGCTGLMGIHWRTRILGPNVSALAKAAWHQSTFNPAMGAAAGAGPAAKPPEGPRGGKFAHFPNNPIAETDDDALYQTVRYDVGAYYFDVPNGKYTVRLQFCEPHYNANHQRVFGVDLQGKRVIDTLDLFRQAGRNKALDYSFKDVEVTDGRLVIEFVYQVEYPCVAAIVVEGPAATRKINCGGPAYQDYAADWPESTSGGRRRFLPVGDFYADWAVAEFGPEAAGPIAELLARIDGNLPRPSTWVSGPGGIQPDARPWEEVRKEYAFVDELAGLGPKVKGAGNLERFEYWLENFRYLRAVGQVNCTWARLNEALKKVQAEKDAEARKRLAREAALPIRKELIAQVAEVHRHLLATVNTPGAMGNVTNWQQHVMPMLLEPSEKQLREILGEDLPADAVLSKEYSGPPRIFVPVVRTGLVTGEALNLQAMVLGASPPEVVLHWRPLGAGDFTKVPLKHVARGVYAVTLPAEAISGDLEYYIAAEAGSGKTLRFPATAPKLNQTVVVVRGQ
jgi:hypothetical protein